MRVVHINTYDIQGGAARSAYGLHKALQTLGHESSLLTRHKVSEDPSVIKLPLTARPADNEKVTALQQIQQCEINQNRTKISNTYFSLSQEGYDLSLHPLVREADIIQLHWVVDLLSPETINGLRNLGKPLVWTLHDQRAFTGGCHFSAGCRKYEMTCADCPQLKDNHLRLTEILLANTKQFLPAHEIAIVAPSRWMAVCARESAVFRNSRISLIPNGIDTSAFRPMPKKEAREKFELNPDAFYFLFGADTINEKRKGFEPLLESIQLCLEESDFRSQVEQGKIGFIAFGLHSEKLNFPWLPIKTFGHINSNEVLRALYAAADIFIMPSTEDNLPTTILEAMSSGTPVIAHDIGGVPDLVTPGLTGWLAPVDDRQKFAEMILASVKRKTLLNTMSLNCALQIQQRHTLTGQAQHYLSLYKLLLAVPKFNSSFVPDNSKPDFALEEVPFISTGSEPLLHDYEARLRAKENQKSVSERIGASRSALVDSENLGRELPVSVLISTRNSMAYLPEHLRSMTQWGDMVQEIVVLDGHSTDGTVDYIKHHFSHRNFRICDSPRGPTQSWNYDLHPLRGKYIYLAPAGDIITREGLLHLTDTAEQLQCDVLLSKPEFISAQGEVFSDMRWPIHRIIEDLKLTTPQILNTSKVVYYAITNGGSSLLGSPASNLYRSEIFKNNSFLPDFGTADHSSWAILNSAKMKFGVTPQACSRIVFHPENSKQNSSELSLQTFQLSHNAVKDALENCPEIQSLAEFKFLCEAIIEIGERLQKEQSAILGTAAPFNGLGPFSDFIAQGLSSSTEKFREFSRLLAETQLRLESQKRLEKYRKRNKFWIFYPMAWEARFTRGRQRKKIQELKNRVKDKTFLKIAENLPNN
ncbi:MAG: glycosyltransferase [Verrucomicrobiota bacterium]|nr:glycosyltransferase [Verrucomicrobiota bacterium]